jgi:DNA-binding NarL/FixJ family response regulator
MVHLLSSREIEIVRLIVGGFTDIEIAAKLNLSSSTVNTHRKNILAKLKLPNTASLVRVAVQNGLDK